MTDRPTQRLSGDEIVALRWAAKGKLSPHQHAQRTAPVRAIRILEDKAFTHGCELHVPTENVDA